MTNFKVAFLDGIRLVVKIIRADDAESAREWAEENCKGRVLAVDGVEAVQKMTNPRCVGCGYGVTFHDVRRCRACGKGLCVRCRKAHYRTNRDGKVIQAGCYCVGCVGKFSQRSDCPALIG